MNNYSDGGTPMWKCTWIFTPIIAPRLSQLLLLCDWPVTHPAVEYI